MLQITPAIFATVNSDNSNNMRVWQMTVMDNRQISLDDKYELKQGRVFINGTQALARIAFLQKELDEKHGINTQGYISGYRGSPLGMLDMTLWREKSRLAQAGVTFQPGLNEDLAATAVWGTQQLSFFPKPKVDGVFAMWYGKAPGVDRSADAIRHANCAGTDKNGGVLLVFGDDHPGKSSTIVNQSEPLLSSLSVPVLYPANVQEIIQFGLLGWQMSRYTGLWTGLKTVNETVEQTQTVDVDIEGFTWQAPEKPADANVNINRGAFIPAANEMVVKRQRIPLVHQFVKANQIDRAIMPATQLGIVTAGKSYEDVLQALQLLDLTIEQAQQLGIGIYKVGCVWPLEPTGMTQFASWAQRLLFVEEKTAMIEPQARGLLYNLEHRPAILGKQDLTGQPLLPSDAQLTPMMIAEVLMTTLQEMNLADEPLTANFQRLVSSSALNSQNATVQPAAMRVPYFCSGCPHNTSTKVPEGSFSMAGIGCHTMAILNRKDTLLPLQMGGEGLNWVGAAPFSGTEHMFQNLGDGTYYHSGLLAIRAAVAAKVNITYKILYNDAVAMTGGQPIDGTITVGQMAKQVLAEGITQCVVVSDNPQWHIDSKALPNEVKVYHRDELESVQKQCRDMAGTTVIIYEQTCAAEKRRRRKRGEMENPAKRVIINDAVCENCGDCSVQSTCVSIQPKATALGTKRQIDQSSCNKDYSCAKGFCPSFVSVIGAEPKKPQGIAGLDKHFATLPAPQPLVCDNRAMSVMIAGIGGTGVITVGAVLGMAAHLENKHCSIYDMTGLSQKNGAVYSHLKIANKSEYIAAAKIGAGEADLVLGFDLVASLMGDAGITFDKHTTTLVGNGDVSPTSAYQFNRDYQVQDKLIREQLMQRVATDKSHLLDATSLALTLTGDTIASNMFMVGFALQKGLLPLSVSSVEQAITLNGTAIKFNLNAFALGRLYASQPEVIQQSIKPVNAVQVEQPESLDSVISQRTSLLTEYQNETYAQQYQQLISQLRDAETRYGNSQHLTLMAAKNLAKLMAYKDEYEVARLHSSDSFKRQIAEQFEPGYTLKFNLAPPLLAKIDPNTGKPRKKEYGAWLMSAFKLLSGFKSLRGSAFDVFGYTEERKLERQLIKQYQDDIQQVMLLMSKGTVDMDSVQKLLSLPSEIRGFGHVKLAAIEQVSQQRQQLLDTLSA
ncbi:indolepyruvate ferredoxin oxidoreductase family protein [Shewanella gaetbuli]